MTDKNYTAHQIAELRKLTVGGLRKKYLDVFGEESRSSNKPYLFKRIAYRIQEKQHGGLTDRARRRAERLSGQAPIRRRPRLKSEPAKPVRKRDPRLPAPGTVLRRTFGKKEYTVKVQEDGFRYGDKTYRSLSAIAKEITGTSWNGIWLLNLRLLRNWTASREWTTPSYEAKA